MIKELNEKTFDEYIKEGIKFIAFSATWCGFCQKQRPILEELSEKNIDIAEVNPDNNPNITNKYDIHSFPSFLLFKNGKLLGKFSGYRSKYDLLNTIMDFLK